MSLLQEGQKIRDTYEVECLLGEGAFGEVYRVRHAFFGRLAMKVLKIAGMTHKETLQLLEEPIMLSTISHPNIIRVYDANTTETPRGQCGFFTMEYVAGGTLDRFWRSHGDHFVPLESTIDIGRQICRGLSVAHQQKPPVIHRDIKPQNILIGYDPSGLRVRICDFGLAKRVNPLTLAATAAGTVSFKAPEVFSDEKADSTAADVWSVGVLLYLLLVDRFPYADAEGHAPRAGQRFMPPFDPPSRFNCMVDPVLDGIVERALALKPKARYQSAGEVLEALMAWQPAVKGQKSRAAQALASDSSTKTVLGNAATSQNAGEAQRMAKQALKMAQQASQLQNAADLMEEAFNKWPELRSRYVGKVKLWRCGVVTPMQTDV